MGWTGSLGLVNVSRCKLLHLEWISRSSCRGSVVTNLTGICEDAGSIPGLPQWVKDLASPQAVEQVADAAGIWHCHGCGCGGGQQLPPPI